MNDYREYEEFLRAKVKMAAVTGFEIEDSAINPVLKPHNRLMVKWLVAGGRRACFAAFGLHKCHGAGTPILMADGSIRKVETLREGEQIMGDDSQPRTILSLATGEEMHLCPMQFDIADRVIEQLSMPGEVVYDPFGGLMTVPYRAILKGRYGVGNELNPSYFFDGAAYCKAAETKTSMPSLFDTLETPAA